MKKIKNYIWAIFEVVKAILHGSKKKTILRQLNFEDGSFEIVGNRQETKFPAISNLKLVWNYCLTHNVNPKTLWTGIIYLIGSVIVLHLLFIWVVF